MLFRSVRLDRRVSHQNPSPCALNVHKAHQDGYAWQTWMSGNAEDTPATWETLIGDCVDGIMTARPVALERMLKVQHIPGPGRSGTDPCP